MLNLNSNEKKKLKFGIALTGVQARDLKGALRLEANGIEYGFPINIVNDKVEVEIPALSTLISEITDKEKYNVKLELIANDTYIIPWSDVARIEVPVSIKVSENIEEESEKITKVEIGVTKVDEIDTPVEKTPRPTKIVEKKKVTKEPTKFGKFLKD